MSDLSGTGDGGCDAHLRERLHDGWGDGGVELCEFIVGAGLHAVRGVEDTWKRGDVWCDREQRAHGGGARHDDGVGIGEVREACGEGGVGNAGHGAHEGRVEHDESRCAQGFDGGVVVVFGVGEDDGGGGAQKRLVRRRILWHLLDSRPEGGRACARLCFGATATGAITGAVTGVSDATDATTSQGGVRGVTEMLRYGVELREAKRLLLRVTVGVAPLTVGDGDAGDVAVAGALSEVFAGAGIAGLMLRARHDGVGLLALPVADADADADADVVSDRAVNEVGANDVCANEQVIGEGQSVAIGALRVHVVGAVASVVRRRRVSRQTLTLRSDGTLVAVQFAVSDSSQPEREAVVIGAGGLRVGSARDNDVVPRDGYVSGHHCLLLAEGEHLRVIDLGSTNGTMVGGVAVSSARVEAPCDVRVGKTTLHVAMREKSVRSAAGFEKTVNGVLMAGRATERLYATADRIAGTDATVFLRGESGTGKDLLAQFIHAMSARSKQGFVAVNCAAIPETLAEAELFGFERGAFTGAVAASRGALRAAHGGTLFLDEVGELSLEMQARLLRSLETRRVRPVGATGEVAADFRLVAATHKDLAELVRAGAFREDLYYRLMVISLEVAPLRDRPDEVIPLAEHFLRECAGAKRRLSSGAKSLLRGYDWPGNVRELRNTVIRAAVLSPDAVIDAAYVEFLPATRSRVSATARGREVARANEEMGAGAEMEVEMVEPSEVTLQRVKAALEAHHGNVARAARSLGISRQRVYRVMARDEAGAGQYAKSA